MVIIGSARVNELGSYAAGKRGDQKQQSSDDWKGEVSKQTFYIHKKGWYILRPKSPEAAKKMAEGMDIACDNFCIGYSQNDRYSIIKYGVKTKTLCNADCSSLVRACILYATGKDVGDFSTANEASVLEKSGLFEKKKTYKAGDTLYPGDVLVTQTKGHTVIVIEGNASYAPVKPDPNHVPLNYKVGVTYVVNQDMNVRTKKANDEPSAIPKGQVIGCKGAGTKVVNKATTAVNGKIWMYIGLDSKKREQWICADSGKTAYIS